MRTLYEHTTLRVTGSDMQGGLAKHGEWISIGAMYQILTRDEIRLQMK